MTNRSSENFGRNVVEIPLYGEISRRVERLMDVLSNILRELQLTGAVYFQRDFHAPWGMEIGGTGFAQFHVITRGSCIVTAFGRSVTCPAGDIVLFPHSAPHMLADAPGTDPVAGPAAMASFAGENPMFAAGGLPTRLICGHYEYRSLAGHPLIAELPAMLHVRAPCPWRRRRKRGATRPVAQSANGRDERIGGRTRPDCRAFRRSASGSRIARALRRKRHRCELLCRIGR
jgi:Cupin